MLLFASLQPELAEAKGVPMRFLSVAFLAVVGVAVAECEQIVGVLLVFTLMVGPASAAQNVSTRFGFGIALSAVFALAEAWGGTALSWETNWPTSFWITILSASVYLASLGYAHRASRMQPTMSASNKDRPHGASPRPAQLDAHRGA